METGTVIESSVVPSNQMNLAGVLQIPAVRQVMLLIGVAAAVAAGFAIVLWSQTPQFTQLASDMSAAEASAAAEVLQAANIDSKMAGSTLLVEESKLYEARMQLASLGLTQAGGVIEALQEQSSFGVSQFMEAARYKHLLQEELGRTIAGLGAVREARVHLAIPKQTAFLRDDKGTSASVFLNLRGGVLTDDQASAIVHMVASSVPNLVPGEVTLVDQYGRLLSPGEDQSAAAQAASRLKYTRQKEDGYKKKIEDMLTPLVGAGRVRAEVSATIDFTYTEETSESFDPANTVVRSEQFSEDRRSGAGSLAGGIPGALTNQPPQATGAAGVATEGEQVEQQNASRSSTRNYEVDRTIRHTRPQAGEIRRLSVAVLIDDSPIAAAAEGESVQQARVTDADIEGYTALVREVVGFDAARGDTVVVQTGSFRPEAPLEEIEPPALWERPGVISAAKQALGLILVLAIAFGVVRPMLQGVVSGGAVSGEYLGAGGAAGDAAAAGQIVGATPAIAGPSYDEKVAAAKNISGNDPARVAQVVKKWVAADE